MALKYQIVARCSGLEVHAIRTLKDNYTYAITTDDPQYTLVVDPGEAAPVLAWSQQLQRTISDIVCTHHHHDHVDGVSDLVSAFSQCRVFTSSHDRKRIPCAQIGLDANQIWSWHHQPIQILFIPGHTQGHMALFFKNPGWLFCGDTLFAMGCGRLLEGEAHQLHQSLQQIKTLPPSTLLFWGHEYSAKNLAFAQTINANNEALIARARALKDDWNLPGALAQELETNPFLGCDLNRFTELRELRNHF